MDGYKSPRALNLFVDGSLERLHFTLVRMIRDIGLEKSEFF
jgi:hypothetical protein